MSLKSVQTGDEVLRKGPWMPEEDEILVEYVRQFGARDWSSIRTKGLLPRTGKSCRLRWVNKLKPDLKRSGCKFSPEEEKLVVEMQAKLGNKWAKIASCLPGRTDNDVKNFWSTRQKRILRALQRPKLPSGSTDASADTSDLSKDPQSTDFGGFQVHSPSGAASLIDSGMGPQFIFAEGDNKFRDSATDTTRCQMLHQVHTFNSMEADDVLSSHHNLSDHIPAGELGLRTCEKEPCTSMTKLGANTKPLTSLVEPLASAPPRVTIASSTTRTIKQRPRSKRETRSTTILSCFEHPVVETSDSGNDSNTFNSIARAPQSSSPAHSSFSSQLSLTDTTLPQSNSNTTSNNTSSNNNNNYLEFLLQSNGPLMQNVQIFSPEFPLFLTNSQQWEKLPTLYSEDAGLYSGCNSKDADSCSPDSVITNFTADVFDSLEPLNSAPSEWWVAQ